MKLTTIASVATLAFIGLSGTALAAVSAEEAAGHIQLVGLINDVSLRNLIPAELAKGFGFLQSKPRSALSPVLVTPDELGADWRDSVLHRPLLSWLNGARFGEPEAGHARIEHHNCTKNKSRDSTEAERTKAWHKGLRYDK